MRISLGPVDYAIIFIYFAFVIGVGWALKRPMKASADFLTSGRSLPAWITGLAFISAGEPWFKRPLVVGLLVLLVTIVLNILFR